MRSLLTFSFFVLLSCSLACNSASNTETLSRRADTDSTFYDGGKRGKAETRSSSVPAESHDRIADSTYKDSATNQSQPSLPNDDSAQSSIDAMNREIIRNADLTIETESPSAAQQRVTSIAEAYGGFVVNSDSKLLTPSDRSRTESEISIAIRVPSDKFGVVLDLIRSGGGRILQEKVTGQDVTEEYIDLEARIKNKKALEAQFMEIMKRASKVEDALSVQSELSSVRTEIEQLEGRRRFLENRSALSTFTVTFRPPISVTIDSTGFVASVKEALRDGIDGAEQVVLFLIRAAIVLVPLAIFVGLPGLWLFRRQRERIRRVRLTRAIEKQEAEASTVGE